jgi:hypothetical protein
MGAYVTRADAGNQLILAARNSVGKKEQPST